MVTATLGTLPVARPIADDAPVAHAAGFATRKGGAAYAPGTLLGTLVQTHSEERVLLDLASPSVERFRALVADHVTGTGHEMDPGLLALLRSLVARHSSSSAAARIELVSGFRSPKLNEMMRKKGHHVASHSQHSLGHAVDFRVVDPGADKATDPRALEVEIRALEWKGGIGVYTEEHDWFVHVDVGPTRRWSG